VHRPGDHHRARGHQEPRTAPHREQRAPRADPREDRRDGVRARQRTAQRQPRPDRLAAQPAGGRPPGGRRGGERRPGPPPPLRPENNEPRVLIREKTAVTGYGVDIELRSVNPALIALLSNQREVVNAQGDVVGNDVMTRRAPSNFAMEVWSKLVPAVDGMTHG